MSTCCGRGRRQCRAPKRIPPMAEPTAHRPRTRPEAPACARIAREGHDRHLVGPEDAAHPDGGDHHVGHSRQQEGAAPLRRPRRRGRPHRPGGRGLRGALTGERQAADDSEDGRDDERQGEGDLHGEHGGEQRPDGEDELVDDALEGEPAAQARRIGSGVRPAGPHHRPDRRLGGTGHGDDERLHDDRQVGLDGQHESDQADPVDHDEDRQRAVLSDPVAPSAGEQRPRCRAHLEGRPEDARRGRTSRFAR